MVLSDPFPLLDSSFRCSRSLCDMRDKHDGADIIIGATGRRYDLTLLSRNTRHFERLDMAVLDPFVALPPK